ncbi:uncharacterized protein RCC_01567 [Ramularia collo-cygni]|uniref:PARP-type domain-containing protein n=1 Tax=Ramularia collo-cygni TaxID=112498 RepID=A0A2D3V608_9PEZI|nr:uncharacterized protein RCC_01567 [Ramularia collo-cygni]CZT15733.1 uncharacterized protein RCC_01567 [Ramularia collo-cygni]
MAYRVELSKTGRAGCTAVHCKKEGIKIQKGELRNGVLVDMGDYQSMKYRHWGCVTPSVIFNWKETSGGDMDLVDGYDELPDECKVKVARAFEQGHVDDEDWNGDLECNRYDPENKKQGMFVKPMTATEKKNIERAEAKAAKEAAKADGSSKPAKKRSRKQAEDEGDEEEAPPAAKKARGKKAKDEDAEADEDVPTAKNKSKAKKARSEAEPEPEPAKKSRARKAKAEPISDEVEAEEVDDEPQPAATKKSKATKKAPATREEPLDEPDDEQEEAIEKPKAKAKGRKKKAASE